MNPYLTFNGNCEAAFRFYEARLGAKIGAIMRYVGSPMAGEVPADAVNKVMHANLTLQGQELMGSDGIPGQPFPGFSGFALSLNADSVAEAENLFAALSEGGQITMPLAETFWASRFGMVTDQFGVPWMVNCEARG